MNLIRKVLLKDNHVCPWWMAYTFDNPLRQLFHKPEQILQPHLLKGMTAVDIGCGMGYFAIAMAEIVGEQGWVLAVDIQQKMLEAVSKSHFEVMLRSFIRKRLAKWSVKFEAV